ncbi:MAG: zincin-like metallopeptidase domain-containing protein [Promethearchaeota archaeon]
MLKVNTRIEHGMGTKPETKTKQGTKTKRGTKTKFDNLKNRTEFEKIKFISSSKDVELVYSDILDNLEEYIEKIIEDERKGKKVKWELPWVVSGILNSNVFSIYRPYKYDNQVLCNLYALKHGWKSKYWITPNKVRELNIRLKKDAKPVFICATYPSISKLDTEVIDAGSTIDSDTHKITYNLLLIPLYNLDQCYKNDTKKIHIPKRRTIKDEKSVFEKAEEVIAKMPNRPKIIHEKQAKAFYHILQDYIKIPKKTQFKSLNHYYETLFHELIHSTGHKSRLNRKTLYSKAYFGDHIYSIEEVIAELSCSMIMGRLGLVSEKSQENMAIYLKSWLSSFKSWKKKYPKFLRIAFLFATNAVDYIFNEIPPEKLKKIQKGIDGLDDIIKKIDNMR